MKVSFKVTERCMAKCACCESRLNLYKEKLENEMCQDVSTELFNHVIEQCALDEEKFLSITGGEPTLLEYLPDAIRTAKNNGFTVKINTNGWDMSYEKLDCLVESGMDIIFLSLYSLNRQTFTELRGNDKLFDRVLNTINIISQYRENSNKMSARLQTVIMKPNFRELPELLKFAIDAKFDAYSTMYLANVPSFPHLQLTQDDIIEFKEEIVPKMIIVIDKSNLDEEVKKVAINQISGFFPVGEITLEDYSKGIYRPNKGNRCNKQGNFIAVYPNGDVYPCYCFDYIKAPEFKDSIKEKKLLDIFKGECFTKFWNDKFEYCKFCPDGKHVWIRLR